MINLFHSFDTAGEESDIVEPGFEPLPKLGPPRLKLFALPCLGDAIVLGGATSLKKMSTSGTV